MSLRKSSDSEISSIYTNRFVNRFSTQSIARFGFNPYIYKPKNINTLTNHKIS
jgi:hypothetical protein